MAVYEFHWKDGEVDTGEGTDVANAFTKLGYGAGALPALDYYEEVSEEKENLMEVKNGSKRTL